MIYLYKPHITGPEGAITSPDVIIDRVIVDGALRSVGQVTTQAWLQVDSTDAGRAGSCIVALGGGAIILPCVILNSGVISLSRSAWRLNNLDGRMAQVTLNGAALPNPAEMIANAGGRDDALPRGFAVIGTRDGDTWSARLDDPAAARTIDHHVTAQPIGEDHWDGARPTPRYAVGPTQKEVTHYI